MVNPNALGLTERILVALRRVMRAVDLHSRRLVQTHSLTSPQLILLREIERNGEIAIGELARRISIGNATATGIVDRLEQRDLVRRGRNGRDRRNVLVTCTDGARQVLSGAPPLLQERFVRELEKLHEWEQAQILSSLERVACMMNAEHLDAAPMLAIYPLDATEDTLRSADGHGAKHADAAAPADGDAPPRSVDAAEFRLRELRQPADFAARGGLHDLAAFLQEALKPYSDTFEDIARGLRDALNGGGFILVAEHDGKTAGALVMLRTGMGGYVPENLLLFVAVDPPLRGKGLGRQLVERGLCLAEGSVKLHVEYDNPARRLYERVGFTSKYAEMRYSP
ncbi:MAG TPA: bifunctional helix-turn-helix transcriptional regulator/GNAT family N-acetyltransferase [Candidatus Bathyarchaeia archaeon]|nr:bifunctional helix-turn-helix transcriptional regulator/GNAT family N-acetyltransferase [Candidatus Bathyarchaeia archaeon]